MALAELLMRLDMCKAEAVEYSVERQLTLWDCRDRVEAKTFSFYVTLRHFSGEFMGKHVGLREGDIAKFERGEEHTYRLPAGACGVAGQHMSVYVYNPGVNGNGTLSFAVETTDARASLPAAVACVAPDTCPAVVQLHDANVTVLRNKEHDYEIRLCILMY
jgi:hypothetical protein